MTENTLSSPEYSERRSQKHPERDSDVDRSRYFTRIVLDHLPFWLDRDIRTTHLSICEWGCVEGENGVALQTHFPEGEVFGIDRSHAAMFEAYRNCAAQRSLAADKSIASFRHTFDVIIVSDMLHHSEYPLLVLQRVVALANRYLVVLVPFRETDGYPKTVRTLDEASSDAHVGPEFELTARTVIDRRSDSGRYCSSLLALLIYRRSCPVPAVDDGPRHTTDMASDRDHLVSSEASNTEHQASFDPQEQIAGGRRELATASSGCPVEAERCIEAQANVAELRSNWDQREAALVSEAETWKAKTAALEHTLTTQAARLEEVCSDRSRLQKELSAADGQYALRLQHLASRADYSSHEAEQLRRLTYELRSSLSWRLTAPLRYVSKPVFALLRQRGRGRTDCASAVKAGKTHRQPVKIAGIDRILPFVATMRNADPIAVIPCAIPFSRTANQRPISCARYFADHGYRVLFVVWQWFADDATPQAYEEVYPGIFQIPLFAFQDSATWIASASQARGVYIGTLPSPGLVDVALSLRLSGYHIHYDIMDDWEEFHGCGEAPWFSGAVEQQMVLTADTVSAVSNALVHKFSLQRSDVTLIRNGYDPDALDCEQFAAARTPLESRKLIGYFGHLSPGWFDWELLFTAAKRLPDVQFEIIGSGLPERAHVRMGIFENIRFVGSVPQHDLHLYARKWSAALIPFRPSALSAAVDPLKVYEYLHLGLPAIVSGVSGIAEFPLVHFTKDTDGFVAAIERVAERPNEMVLSQVSTFLKTCTWDARWDELRKTIGQRTGLESVYAD